MRSLPYRDMLAATHLTRSGNLAAATALLQQTLRQAVTPTSEPDRKAATEKPHMLEGLASQHPSTGTFLSLRFENAAGARAYKLYVPSGYHGRRCALVVMLHGCTQSADDFAAGTQMNMLAEEQTFLVAYPEQCSSANISRCWNWFERAHQQRGSGEPSLIAGITRRIMDEYAVDEQRVYVAGMSAGAAAAAVLGVTYPDLYAAVGIHSGLAYGLAHDVPSAFAAMRNGMDAGRAQPTNQNHSALPTIVFHGDRDATVHARNGDRFADGFAAAERESHVRAGRVPGGRAYTQTTILDERGLCILEQWLIHGAGHAWSGGNASGSYTDPLGPSASREMIRFFFSHRLGAA